MAASKEYQDITYRATAGSPPYRTGWEQSDGTGRAAMSECSVPGGSLSCNLTDQSTCCQPKSLTARLLPIILLTQFSMTGWSIELQRTLCLIEESWKKAVRKTDFFVHYSYLQLLHSFMSMSCCACEVIFIHAVINTKTTMIVCTGLLKKFTSQFLFTHNVNYSLTQSLIHLYLPITVFLNVQLCSSVSLCTGHLL